ncbi:MAG: hypothetical protein ACFFBM_11045 [Promethearchaeota archaeon]
MSRVPKWAYLMSAALIVIAFPLAWAIVDVFLRMLPQGLDIQGRLLFVILPLGILSLLIVVIMAILLTRKRE